jgi:hypothetical protein
VPIDLRGRPIGVTILSFTAFAFSPVFVVLLGVFLFNLLHRDETPSFSNDPGAFLWLCFWLLIVSVCFLTLAWVSYKAGLELW